MYLIKLTFVDDEHGKSKRYNTSPKDSEKKRNKTVKHTKDIEKSKKSSKSNETDKYDASSKKSKFTNLEITSVSKETKDAQNQSVGRKRAKTEDLFEERTEKKKQRAVMYEKYLQRGGARNPGSKEIPIVRNLICICVI